MKLNLQEVGGGAVDSVAPPNTEMVLDAGLKNAEVLHGVMVFRLEDLDLLLINQTTASPDRSPIRHPDGR